MSFTLEGRTAMVTGAGRGIGRAIAERLITAGANVMLSDMDEELLLEAKAELGQPQRVRHFTGDLTDPSTPEAVVEVVQGAFGSLHIIVNNAGYSWDNVIQKTAGVKFHALLGNELGEAFRGLGAAAG